MSCLVLSICVALCRLVGLLGEVVAHGGSTVSQIPLQGFPSPVYPALHEHLYEPTVFWHAELTSQEWEPVVHSPKFKRGSTQRLFVETKRLFSF